MSQSSLMRNISTLLSGTPWPHPSKNVSRHNERQSWNLHKSGSAKVKLLEHHRLMLAVCLLCNMNASVASHRVARLRARRNASKCHKCRSCHGAFLAWHLIDIVCKDRKEEGGATG